MYILQKKIMNADEDFSVLAWSCWKQISHPETNIVIFLLNNKIVNT